MKNLLPMFVLASLPLTASADWLQLTYHGDKAAHCAVTMQYYDGDKRQYTCEVTDKGTYRSSGNQVTLNCPSGDSIRHLEDGSSSIFIKSSCQNTIKQIRAKKTYKKDKSKGAERFGRNKNNDPISGKLWGNTQYDDCFRRLSISGERVRIVLNKTHNTDKTCKLAVIE